MKNINIKTWDYPLNLRPAQFSGQERLYLHDFTLTNRIIIIENFEALNDIDCGVYIDMRHMLMVVIDEKGQASVFDTQPEEQLIYEIWEKGDRLLSVAVDIVKL